MEQFHLFCKSTYVKLLSKVQEIEALEKSAVRVFNRFLDSLEDRLGQRRLVLMFDEFELIETKIDAGKLDADLLGYFRSLMQHRQGLLFIFTGTHRLEEMSHDYWSILFNIARVCASNCMSIRCSRRS
jgi:hypothetical protein